MFNNYKLINYSFTTGNNIELEYYLRDISTSINIKGELLENGCYFDYYTLSEGETFESIAYKYYGNTDYFYLVILSGYVFDWRNNLPLTDSELEYYIEDTYVNPNGIHHYIDSKTGKRTTSTTGANVVPVTNTEYEQELNEEKRYIKLIKSSYADKIDDMINGVFNV